MESKNKIEFATPVNPGRRWFVFLGGGVAWTLHLLSIYAIGEFGCVSGLGKVMYYNVSVVSWLILIDSAILLLTASTAAVVGYVDVRNEEEKKLLTKEDEGGAYLSKFGLILDILFSVIILVETIPVFSYLHGC